MPISQSRAADCSHGRSTPRQEPVPTPDVTGLQVFALCTLQVAQVASERQDRMIWLDPGAVWSVRGPVPAVSNWLSAPAASRGRAHSAPLLGAIRSAVAVSAGGVGVVQAEHAVEAGTARSDDLDGEVGGQGFVLVAPGQAPAVAGAGVLTKQPGRGGGAGRAQEEPHPSSAPVHRLVGITPQQPRFDTVRAAVRLSFRLTYAVWCQQVTLTGLLAWHVSIVMMLRSHVIGERLIVVK